MSIIICSSKLSDEGTITASDEVPTFEASKLLQMSPSLKWRSLNLTPSLVGHLSEAATIHYASLAFSNAKASTTKRFRLATSEGNLTASPLVDSGVVSFWPEAASSVATWSEAHSRWFSQAGIASALWYRWDIDHSASGDDYFEAGRIFVSEGVQFIAGETKGQAIYPYGATDVEEVVETVNHDGEEVPRPRRTRSGGSIQLWGLSDAEVFGGFRPLCRERGSSKDVLVDVRPTETVYPLDFIMIGRMKDPRSYMNTYFQHWDASINVLGV